MKNYKITSAKSALTGTTFYLEIFKKTSLRRTSQVGLHTLDMAFRYNIMDKKLQISYWDNEEFTVDENQLTLRELLEDCYEVQEFAREHFPEFAI